MSDPFAEYEQELYEKGQAEIAQEKAAWAALPQSEKDRLNAEREARLEAMWGEESDEDSEDDEDEEE